MSDVTQILAALDRGESSAAAQLLPLVYDELRRLAAARMAQEKPGQTLDGTALIHEAYLWLVGAADDRRWQNRGHFFAAAAEAMRRILVENARRKNREKHGGGRRQELSADGPVIVNPMEDVIAVDEALEKLARVAPQAAELVKLHYFAGLTIDQSAEVLGVSVRKAYTIWAFARAGLFRCLGGEGARFDLNSTVVSFFVQFREPFVAWVGSIITPGGRPMRPTPPNVQSIFGRALEIGSATDRAAYLDAVCGPDADLRVEVEGLLAALDQAGEFLRRPAVGTVDYEPMTDGPGIQIGPYKLMEKIGEGGMGEVWVADQQEPIRRRVALKVIKPNMDSRSVLARFEAERQALTLMDHRLGIG